MWRWRWRCRRGDGEHESEAGGVGGEEARTRQVVKKTEGRRQGEKGQRGKRAKEGTAGSTAKTIPHIPPQTCLRPVSRCCPSPCVPAPLSGLRLPSARMCWASSCGFCRMRPARPLMRPCTRHQWCSS